MIKILYNPRCSKSRQALEFLKEKVDKKDIQIVEYLHNVPSVECLSDVCKKLNISPRELIRKKEDIYKKLRDKYGEPTEEQALDWMHDNPKIIERPIVINGEKAAIGRPIENIIAII